MDLAKLKEEVKKEITELVRFEVKWEEELRQELDLAELKDKVKMEINEQVKQEIKEELRQEMLEELTKSACEAYVVLDPKVGDGRWMSPPERLTRLMKVVRQSDRWGGS